MSIYIALCPRQRTTFKQVRGIASNIRVIRLSGNYLLYLENEFKRTFFYSEEFILRSGKYKKWIDPDNIL